MRKRVLAIAFVGAVALGSAAGAIGSGGASATPGPNGNNTYGLCKAYFSGSAKGQEQKRKAPPFAGLEAAAEAMDQTVEEYCAANGQKPGGGGGNGGGEEE